VDEPTCREEWYDLSSDKTSCQNYDASAGAGLDLVCKFCCTEDGCNVKAEKPLEKTLYVP